MRDTLIEVKGWRIEGRYWVRLSDGLRLPVIQGGGKTVTVQNDRYAFGDDDGSESGHSLDTENTDRTSQEADVTFLIRIQVEETGGGSDALTAALFAQKNSTGGFNEVTTGSTNGVIIANDTQSRSDDENTTERLTAGAGSFTAGKYDDGQTQQGTTAVTLSSQYTDFEFAIQIDSANAITGDDFEFRIEWTDGTDLDSYPGSYPTVTAATIPVNISLSTATLTASGQSISVSTPQGEVWKIDFEEGDTSDFDSLTDSGSDISATGSAAMVGSYGMQIDIDGSIADIFGHKALSISTNEIRFRFYFDPDGISMADGDKFHLLDVLTDGSYGGINDIGYVNFQYTTALGLEVTFQYTDDSGSSNAMTWFVLSDTVHYIECYIKRETSDGQADGVATYWVDGNQKDTSTTVDNFNVFPTVDEITWGADGIDAGTSGIPYYDDLIVRDDNTEIGSAGLSIVLDTAALTANGQILGLSPGAVTKLMDTAALTAGGQALSLSMGAVTTGLNTAGLTAYGQALSLLMGAVSTGLNTALLTANGQVITIDIGGGPQTIPLDTALLTANGQVLTLAPGEATTGLVTALLTANGQALVLAPGEAITVLNTAALAANGQTLSFSMGAVSTGLNTALLTANGQVINVSIGFIISLDTATLTANGQALILAPGAVTTGLDTALLNALGQSLGVSPGAVSIALFTAALSSNGQSVVLSPGAVSTLLDTAALTADGQNITVTLIEALTILLNTAGLTANGQAISIFIPVVLIDVDAYITQQKEDSLFITQEDIDEVFITQQVEDEGHL